MLNPSSCIRCQDFPCAGVDHTRYAIPDVELDPARVRILMIAEAPSQVAADGFYVADDSFYMQTTIQAFAQAGVSVSSMADILEKGIYLTTAIKCAKVSYGVPAETIHTCAEMLQREIALFPNVEAFLLMGDFAIKALNDICRREGGKRVIPSGSTYKIRGGRYSYKGIRAFPSYLQTGKSFLIEKSKQEMIAEDIRAALDIVS